MGLLAHCRITEDCLSIENRKVIAMTEQPHCIGYIRTSPTDSHPNVQADALKQAGYTELHEANSLVDPREAFKELLDLLGSGDTLAVYRLNRLGREEHSVTNFQQMLQALGVTLVVISNQETAGGNHAK